VSCFLPVNQHYRFVQFLQNGYKPLGTLGWNFGILPAQSDTDGNKYFFRPVFGASFFVFGRNFDFATSERQLNLVLIAFKFQKIRRGIHGDYAID